MHRLISIHFQLHDGSQKSVKVEHGQTILQAALANDIPIEGACEGNLACSTCHVVVGEGWFNRLPAAQQDEADMLDLAYGVTKTSRLGCQIKVTAEMDGLVLKLPPRA